MIRFLLLLLSSIVCLGASAQMSTLEQGKLYRFTLGTNAQQHLSALNSGRIGSSTTANPGKSEMWYVADVRTDASGVKSYRLRNYGFGTYLRGAPYNNVWTLTGAELQNYDYLYLVTLGGSFNSLSVQNSTTTNDKMHLGGSGFLMSWTPDATNSRWNITEVEGISEQEIAENWQRVDELNAGLSNAEAIQAHLDAMYTSKGCTTLKSEYTAMSEHALLADSHYTGLPATLQQMTLKIWRTANGTDVNTAWAEENYDLAKPSWDGEYAKRYRIQKYEPYTERNCVANGLVINAHSNFNNPTGIFANSQRALYIMVEGEIKPGATLYLGSAVGHAQDGETTSGTQLHEGLNIIPFYRELEWTQIYYAVGNLMKWNGTTNKASYRLSDYPDLTIHIEGGNVNGYYNAVGDDLYAHGRTGQNVYPQGDDENDWDYLAARNNLTDLTILGKYVTFQFYFAPTNGSNTTDYYFTKKEDGTRLSRIPDVVEIWDRVALSQRLVMGVASEEELNEANSKYPTLDDPSRGVFAWTGRDSDLGCDYSDHYRQHYLAWGQTTGYMSGGWYTSNYNVTTFNDILRTILNGGGTLWGPGHEIGHQNQRPFNMNGLTEVTNNLFANVALWYGGTHTSRLNGGTLSTVLDAYYKDNSDFFNNNIWAQTHLYYKLWLYYHLTGHNNKFYPRLFEYLRRNPMQIAAEQSDPTGAVSGKTPLLHFYRAACIAAGEDLTEFFSAYGFFTPMDRRFVGDYSSSYYTQTEEQIAAVKAEIAAMNLPKNESILFINDTTAEETYGHDGVTPRTKYQAAVSDMGGYKEVFIEKPEITGDFTATMTSSSSITVSGGTGAAGIKIYSSDGTLLAFSDTYTFTITPEVLAALAEGDATINVYSADGIPTPVSYDSDEAARMQLDELVAEVAANIAITDDGGESGTNYTKIGHFKATSVEEIQKLVDAAREIMDNRDATLYVECREMLKKAYDDLKADANARVSYIPGARFVLVNKGYTTRYMTESANILTTAVFAAGATPASLGDNAKWVFEAVEGTDNIYMRNVGTGNYIGNTTRGNYNTPTGGEDVRKPFVYGQPLTGIYTFACEGETNRSLHSAASHYYRVVGWNDNDNGYTRWVINMVDIPEDSAVDAALRELVDLTDALISKVTINYSIYAPALTEHNVDFSAILMEFATANGLLLDENSTTADKKSCYERLLPMYEEMLEAVSSVDNADLEAARAQLRNAMEELNLLLADTDTSGYITEEESLSYNKNLDVAEFILTYGSMEEISETTAELRSIIEEIRRRMSLVTDRSELASLMAEMKSLLDVDYSDALNPVGDEETATASNAYDEAETTYLLEELTEDEYKAAIETLRTAKEAFAGEVAYALLPIVLTVDPGFPEWYVITADGIANAHLEYRGADTHRITVAIEGQTTMNDFHRWYFERGDVAPGVRIVSMADPQRVLSIANGYMTAGWNTAQMLPRGDAGTECDQWIINAPETSARSAAASTHSISPLGADGLTLAASGNAGEDLGLKETTSGEGMLFSFEKRDITTGLPQTVYTPDEDDVIFNLQGIRVNRPGKGLYIINGKKVYLD